ncbi:hypothetical protein K502DRAFT_368015 [Neoconidiobolus thromboides FSU 785]|nr:hypothetical protein K502DRAFT_368015 [Neoconidiobolus thromboides FSU 785]
MNELILTYKPRIRQACDRCFKSKRRCDLLIPACSYCKEKKKNCTRERIINRRPRMYNNEEFLSNAFVLFKSNRIKKKIKAEDAIGINHKYFNQFKISAGGTRFNSNISIASVFPIKMFHSSIMFGQDSYLFYKAAPNQYLSLFFDKLPSVKLESTVIKSNSNISNIMPQLVALYFQRFNTLLPLFTYSQFMNKKRDSVLIYSMMLVSLTQTNGSENLSELKVYLKDLLVNTFKPSQLKISLSNIQSMVILLNGLKGYGSSLPSYCFSNLNNHCILLGLHLNYRGNIERKLCYSAVIYLLTIDDPYSNVLFDTHDLWKENKMFLNISKEELNEKKMQQIVLVYSNYCYKCGLFFRYFFDTLLHINSLIISNEKMSKIVGLLESLSSSINKPAIRKLNIIKKSISNKVSIEIIDTLINHIKIIYYSNWTALYDIKSLASQRNKEQLFCKYTVINQPENPNLLKVNIEHFLIYNSKLTPSYFSTIRFFAFIIIFNAATSYSKWIKGSAILLEQISNQFNELSKNHDELLSFMQLIIEISTQ